MRLAITGGAGFLGYHICNKLSNKYKEILVLDIVPIDPKEYPSNVRYFNVDVRNKDQLNEVLKKDINVIIHAAAALPLYRKKDIFDVNIIGTKNILELAKSNNIERVIYISSSSVYGIPKKHPIYENDLLSGVGSYGQSKIKAERLCEQYREKGLCVTIIRPKTFVGAGRLGIFQILYDWIDSGKKIPIIGNGKNHYQLLAVEDLVDAISILLTAPTDIVNDTFNVGAEKVNTVKENLDMLCYYANTGSRVFSLPTWLIIPSLTLFNKLKLCPIYKWVYKTAITDSFISIEKIKTTFGWSPKYSNTQALLSSYKWYLENKNRLVETGITHRSIWKQGILSIFKKFF